MQARRSTDAGPSSEDDWELDPAEVTFHDKIASGAFGDLYRGVYCGQDVAIKILRNVQTNSQQYQEFQQVCSTAPVHQWLCYMHAVGHLHTCFSGTACRLHPACFTAGIHKPATCRR